MKKITSLPMAFPIAVLILSVIGCATQESQIVVAQLQQGVLKFEGEWIVSDYQEGGNKTLTYDGDTVRIVKRGDVYSMDGPDWFFSEVRFKLDRTKLAGTIVADMERLKTNWPTASPSVLGVAYGKIVFSGTLTMLQDGRIVGKHDNWMISISRNPDRFDHATRYPGHYSFILTRKR